MAEKEGMDETRQHLSQIAAEQNKSIKQWLWKKDILNGGKTTQEGQWKRSRAFRRQQIAQFEVSGKK